MRWEKLSETICNIVQQIDKILTDIQTDIFIEDLIQHLAKTIIEVEKEKNNVTGENV